MKILITGANGLLGPYLVEACSEHEVITTTRELCDLVDRESVKVLLLTDEPDVVIHAAAETDVGLCESDPIKALEANRDTTANLVELLSPTAKLVYISTDMVYPETPGPHLEDEAAPVNMYGLSKLAGENMASINLRHLILRTNFFGPALSPGRVSFSDWCLQTLTESRTAIFFNDVWWSPLHMKTLSEVILGLVEADVIGTYNLGSLKGMTKAGFAISLASHKGLSMDHAIGPSHFAVRRPKDLRLDCTKLAEKGWVMPTLEQEIAKL